MELFCLVPAAASANWDAAFTVKGIKLEALVAEATWWQLEVDILGLPVTRSPDWGRPLPVAAN